MKINSSHLIGAAIALAAVFFSKLDVQSTPAPVPAERQQWEYLHMSMKANLPVWFDAALNDYGKAGWELVALQITPREKNQKEDTYHATFKRPKQ